MRLDMNAIKALRNLDGDDVLETLGLRRRGNMDWVAPAVTALGVGILVGAGLGLLLAPKSGREIREDLRQRLRQDSGSESTNSIGQAANSSREPLAHGA